MLELQKASSLGESHPDTLSTLNNVENVHAYVGQKDKAKAMLEDCLQKRKVALGESHQQTLNTLVNLVSLYYEDDCEDEKAKLRALYEEHLLQLKNVFGKYHPASSSLKPKSQSQRHPQRQK